MKVVVTGGAGFIGANVCRHFADQPWVKELIALDDLSTGSAHNLNGIDVELVEGSILDEPALDAALRGADAVVHLAARPSVPKSIEDPTATNEANVTGTLAVLEAMRRNQVGHITLASSSSVYGANPVLPKSEGLLAQPMSPYAVSKLAAEQYAIAYAHVFGLETLAFRFFNVFGPLQPAGHAYAAVIPAFIDAALRDRPIPVHGDGTQTRDFTYVDTVAQIIGIAVRERRSSLSPVNLAFGGRYSLLEVIEELERLLGRELRVDHQERRPGDVPHSQADQRAVRAMFPEVEPMPFADGLRQTLAWHRSNRRSPS